MPSSIRVIIVNYNASETIAGAVQSVLDSGERLHLSIHDNASSDGSLELVQRLFSGVENLDTIAGDENIGFARAVNVTARSGDEEYLLILNPDCELFAGALSCLRAALENDPEAALAGPLVVDSEGAVERGTLRNFPDPWVSFVTFSGLWRLHKWFPVFRGVERNPSDIAGSAIRAEAVSGACMLVRREQFSALGGLDEGYGLHCEDLDLMYRLDQQGFHCLLVPEARAMHQQGVSSRSRPGWVHRQKHLGMQRFFNKFQARRYSFPMRWLVATGIWLRYALTLPLALMRR